MAYVLSQVQGCLQRRHISSRKLTEIEVQCIADTGDGRVALSHLIGDIMQSTRCRVLAAAALFGILAAGTVRADDTRVPTTGSAQGEIVPNALPGGGPAHTRLPKGHMIAPSGQAPDVGSSRGIQPPNSPPGATALNGEAQPHSDVVSPAGLIPNSNEGVPRTLNLR